MNDDREYDDPAFEDRLRGRLTEMAETAEPSADLRRRVLTETLARRRRRMLLVPVLAGATAVVAGALLVPRVLDDDSGEKRVDFVEPDRTTSTTTDSDGAGGRPVRPEGWERLPQEGAPSARRAHVAVATDHGTVVWGGTAGEDEGTIDDGAVYRAGEGWTTLPAAPISGLSDATAVSTGDQVIVWGGFTGRPDFEKGQGAILTLTGGAAEWEKLPDAPVKGRFGHAAAWTGTEMLVWGGGSQSGDLADGAAYDPKKKSWRKLSAAPIAGRRDATAVWSGDAMIVFGGMTEDGSPAHDGAAYDPGSDSWKKLAAAPIAARTDHTAVWTGSKMIVWGGGVYSGDRPVVFDDGAVLDPETGAWSSFEMGPAKVAARSYHSAVWTGREMVVWGGAGAAADENGGAVDGGGAYDMVTGQWRKIPASGLRARTDQRAVWDGEAMFVWGGSVGELSVDDGARYFPGPAGPSDPPGGATPTSAGGGPSTTAAGGARPTSSTTVVRASAAACGGDGGTARNVAEAFLAARATGSGADGCLTRPALDRFEARGRQQLDPETDDLSLCLYRCGDAVFVSGRITAVNQADANSSEVSVSLTFRDAKSGRTYQDVDTLAVGAGASSAGDDRRFVVRGAGFDI